MHNPFKRINLQPFLDQHPWLAKWVLNKYALTIAIFAIIFLFVGDQSFVRIVHRIRQEHALEQQINASRERIDAYSRQLNNLAQPDSLERFAREHYYMHAPNEDVYVVK